MKNNDLKKKKKRGAEYGTFKLMTIIEFNPSSTETPAMSSMLQSSGPSPTTSIELPPLIRRDGSLKLFLIIGIS